MSKQLFYQGQPTDAATTLVAASQATRTIDAATVVNPTAGAVTLTLYLVQDGDAAAADVALYSAFSVAAGETVTLAALVNQCIPRNAVISGLASAAASLTLTISGRAQ